jgi:hypothetical protein
MKQFIYKIIPKCDHNEDEVYFGSTNIPLKIRWNIHRSQYKRWKNGIPNYYASFILFDKYGVANCEIIILEEVENLTKLELKSIESKYITSQKCVNKNMPNRTYKEWYIDNREERLEYLKEYYIDNKEHITIFKKEKFICECGGKYIRANKARHFKLNKHLKYLNENNTQNI